MHILFSYTYEARPLAPRAYIMCSLSLGGPGACSGASRLRGRWMGGLRFVNANDDTNYNHITKHNADNPYNTNSNSSNGIIIIKVRLLTMIVTVNMWGEGGSDFFPGNANKIIQ